MPSTTLGLVGLSTSIPGGVLDLLVPQGFTLVALAYDDTQEEERQRAADLQAKFPDLEIVPDAAALVDRGVQAALCAPQAHRRLEASRPLIAARIPTVIDKQLAPDYARARQILDLVETHDAPLMAGSSLRFSRCYTDLRQMLHAGKIGTPLFAECFIPHGTTPGYWQDLRSASGGFCVNFGIHVVEPLIAALGPEVVSVHAYAAKQILTDADSEDTLVVTAQWASGAIGIGRASAGYRYGEGRPSPTVPSFAVHASDGALEAFVDESDVKVYRGGNFGVTDSYHHDSGMVGYAAAFAEMVRTGVRPIPLAEMDMVMRVLDAARTSITTGQTVSLR